MKRGRGGDSVEALRAIWMEGYMRGRADSQDAIRTGQPRAVPVVPITAEDIARVYEPGACGRPECPCSQPVLEREASRLKASASLPCTRCYCHPDECLCAEVLGVDLATR